MYKHTHTHTHTHARARARAHAPRTQEVPARMSPTEYPYTPGRKVTQINVFLNKKAQHAHAWNPQGPMGPLSSYTRRE